MVPISFDDIREQSTGKTRVRMVNIDSEGYRVAREYMTRLGPRDFEDPAWIEKMAAAGNTTAEEFCKEFEYLAGNRLAVK